MTLDDVARQLPNGFHDAHLLRLAVDYIRATGTLDLDLWVGTPAGATDAERERYRAGRVRIEGLLWCVIDPPNVAIHASKDGFRIDAGRVADLKVRPEIPLVPSDAFSWWFFVTEWNAFVYVAGRTAVLEWKP